MEVRKLERLSEYLKSNGLKLCPGHYDLDNSYVIVREGVVGFYALEFGMAFMYEHRKGFWFFDRGKEYAFHGIMDEEYFINLLDSKYCKWKEKHIVYPNAKEKAIKKELRKQLSFPF